MHRLFRMRPRKVGLPPGTLVHVGDKRSDRVRVTILDYDQDHLIEEQVESPDRCLRFIDKPTVTWIDVVGLHQVEVVEEIGGAFGIHPLVLEDILNTEQRPKMENFDDRLFLVLKMLRGGVEEIQVEQLSLIVGRSFVMTFQESGGDVFDAVRDRIRQSKGRIRRLGPDYLAYALIDAVVDNYFVVLDEVGEDLELLEGELLSNPTAGTSHAIQAMKQDLIILRKSIWPLREVIGMLSRGESPLFQESTEVYLRDVYDHTIQVTETIETFRDMLSGMLDVYLTTISNRMNEIMKVLAIIATTFIPLTLVAGIYGMNFEYMPELKWHWGYPVVLLFMALVAVLMLLYFKRKGWL